MQLNGGTPTTTTYNAANEITNAGFTYDTAGNLTNDGTASYTYDALNRTTARGSTSYTYNGDGTLVSQASGGVTTLYSQDLAAPLSQVLQTKIGAAARTDYLYGLGRLASLNSGVKTWYVADALGSVRRTVTDAGVPLGVINYDPWGTVETGTVPTFGFTGELQDVSAGLVNLRARWYSTTRGRFTTQDMWAGDTARSQTLNPYAYVGDNPSNLRDPSGRCYPPVEFLRQQEPLNCSNLDQAWRISQHPNASTWERIQANSYIVGWYGSHLGVVVGALGTGYAALDAGIAWIGQSAAVYLAAHEGVATALGWGGVALNIGVAGVTTYQAACGDENARAAVFAMGALSAPVLLPQEQIGTNYGEEFWTNAGGRILRPGEEPLSKFPILKQPNDATCLPTCASMAEEGLTGRSSDILELLKASVTKNDGMAGLEEIAPTLQNRGWSTTIQDLSNRTAFRTIAGDLGAGDAVIAEIQGHAVLVRSIEPISGSSNAEAFLMTLNDPATGKVIEISFVDWSLLTGGRTRFMTVGP